jgi:hypothetical protein
MDTELGAALDLRDCLAKVLKKLYILYEVRGCKLTMKYLIIYGLY